MESGAMHARGGGLDSPPAKVEITVRDIAREVYDRSRKDVKKAARAMERKIRGDESLLRELSEEFIRMVCVVATDRLLRSDRAKAWTPPANYDEGGHGDRVHVLARSNQEMLMHFPLPQTRTPLGD